MKKEILYTMPSPYRDDFKIFGYRFGEGKHTLAVVGALRGDEIQQQFTCASLIKRLSELEQEGALMPDHEILVIPSVNPFSMNIGKRFWSMDNTDINRMFPGYDKGETTQRIAASLFESVKDYKYGIQLASYYVPGEFVPHVRMLNTGYHPEKEAKYFGLPYVYVKDFTPYDTTLLNYNWQIWGVKAFSIYTGHTNKLVEEWVDSAVESLLRFMAGVELISSSTQPGFHSQVIFDGNLIAVKSVTSGILDKKCSAHERVKKGALIAQILDPYDASIKEEIFAPIDGVIFFNQENPLVIEGAKIVEIVKK